MPSVKSLLEEVNYEQTAKDLRQIQHFLLRNYDGESIKASYIETVEHTRDIMMSLPKIINSPTFNEKNQDILLKNMIILHQTLLAISDEFEFENDSKDNKSLSNLLRSFSNFYPLFIILKAEGE